MLSSLGKGIAAASIGALMENRGLKISLLKMDPYINVDPGTMNPFQHGEVFVTDDGVETDLDLGHYERFTSCRLGTKNNFTTGQVYLSVINQEREGELLGQTIQVIPHITNEIKENIRQAADGVDILIGEVGGTVGDIEGMPFFEAIRQFKVEEGPENVIFIHLSLIPYLPTSGELKTKPTQHSVKNLREIGIQPDILLCRADRDLSHEIKEKLALFCNLQPSAIITARDVKYIYEIPLLYQREGLDDKICEKLNIWSRAADLIKWHQLFEKLSCPKFEVDIGIIGKYVQLTESYKSLNEALLHGGIANNAKVNLHFIDSTQIEEKGSEVMLKNLDGILVPGGFGSRGIEGKILAVQFARENKVPFFGICLGLQMAVIEFARNICQMPGANSAEFDSKNSFPVIHLMKEQKEISGKGATMRLGSYPCAIAKSTFAFNAYQKEHIDERHRHRFEVNNQFRGQLAEKGLIFSGRWDAGDLVEIVEIKEHPWFLGCQFHPEFKSRPTQPHPLFRDFIAASLKSRL